ncbi:MAG: hypothetical protein ACSHX9_03645 [Luteolibacter sp.]
MYSEDAVREAFRKGASGAHPDSGGNEVEFAAMQVAQEALLSPSKRLKEWLGAKGEEVDSRGQIETGLMDLFQKVAEVGSGAEAAIKAAEAAQSALAKGMAEVGQMNSREQVKDLLVKIEAELQERVSRFRVIEESEDFRLASETMRDLIFLEKWKGTLKGLFGRLM